MRPEHPLQPAKSSPGDLDLVRAITDGDKAALGSLYDRYGRLVFSLAASISGDDASAEEITQDIFTQVWYKAATYQPELAAVSTWLTSMTRHRSIDLIRRLKVRPEGHQINWEDESTPEIPAETNVEGQAETDLQSQRLRHAMSALPEDQRHVLVLAYFQGYTQQEIAEICHEPLGTIKTRVRLAMQKLRLALEERE
jgi:RNA polymerase sigma-70 factor (ECF subfamily)